MDRLFASLRLPYCTYEGIQGGPGGGAVDPSQLDPDPLVCTNPRCWCDGRDTSVVASIKIDALRESLKQRAPARAEELDSLRNEESLRKLLRTDPTPLTSTCSECQASATSTKYTRHISAYVEWGLLLPMTVVFFVAKIFAVAKSCGKLARSIFDGRRMNSQCKAPPSLHLMPLKEQLWLAHQRGHQHVVVADWRHFYHQIGLNPGVSRYFGIFHEKKLYGSRSLPMGWSHSCYLAQLVSWAIIAHRDPTEKPLYNEESWKSGMPRFLEGEDVLVFLLYDNVLITAKTFGAAKRAEAQLLRNAKRFACHIKHCALHNAHQLAQATKPKSSDPEDRVDPCIHLGVQIGVITSRPAHLCWRLDPEKVEKWKKAGLLRADENHALTRRDWAKRIGISVHASSILRRPLHTMRPLLHWASVIGKEAHGGPLSAWDKPATAAPAKEVYDNFNEISEEIQNRSEWLNFGPMSRNAPTLLATDASDSGYAWVVLTHGGGARTLTKSVWTTAEKEWHIYLKELATASWCVQSKLKRHPDRSKPYVIVAVDNTAAIGTLRRMYAVSDIAQAILTPLIKEQERTEAHLEWVPIPSKMNVADCPSRGLPTLDDSRISETRRVISEYLEGKTQEQLYASPRYEVGKNRHCEIFDQEIDGDSTLAAASSSFSEE